MTLLRHLLAAAVGLVAIYLISTAASAYQDVQLAEIGYFVCAAAGLTLLTGTSGQISLGHGAFMAAGAYITALLMAHGGVPFAVVLTAAALGTAAIGALIGTAAARLRGPYLAGVTLAFAVGLPAIANYGSLANVLGGENGLTVAPSAPPASLGATFPLERWQAWIAGLATVVVLFLLANLQHSRLGRSMRAIRDDEVAASLAGLRVARVQVLAFVVSAGCAGVGGGLLAFVTNLAAPGAFPLSLSLGLLAAVILGGLGSLAGAVYGSILLVVLPTWASNLAGTLHLSRNVYANLPLVVYGGVLIVAMLAFPTGIQGAVRTVCRAARRAVPLRRT